MRRRLLGYLVMSMVTSLVVGIMLWRVILRQSLTGAIILLVVVLGLVGFGGIWWIVNQSHQKMALLSQRLAEMRQNDSFAHVLLPQNDAFYELAVQINLLQSQHRELATTLEQRTVTVDALLKNIPLGIMIVDQNHNVTTTNPAMATILGRSIHHQKHPLAEDVMDFELLQLINQSMAQQINQRQVMVLNQPVKRTVEVRTIYTVADHQVLVILYDISEVVAMEQMQFDFISNASHELKTPVTSISGFAKTLLGPAGDDAILRHQFLTIIDQESDRLVELINDVLTISHIESDTVTDAKTTVNLLTLVEAQERELQQMSAKKQITIVTQTPAELSLLSHQSQLGQIMRNLMTNAIKYNRLGGRVTVSAEAQSDQIVIKVMDNGIGISTEDQTRIFERFFRADRSHTQQTATGTGLGLAIVQELVQSMSGTITVSSQLGVGTTFTVVLPN